MKFDTIVFLVIAFNIVAAVLKRRAKKSPKPEGGISSKSPPESQGGGLFDQLARELGLKLPEPEPVPLPDRPVAMREIVVATPSFTAPAIPFVQPPFQESQSVPAPTRSASGPFSGIASQLQDRHRIQEAWVLREILEPPVSMRRKR